MPHFLSGLLLGLGIIVGIGMQNMYVIKQGVLRQHHLWVALFSALCDTVLILLSMLGTASLLHGWPQVRQIMLWGAVVFLVGYGAMSWRSAYQHYQRAGPTVDEDVAEQASLRTVFLATLGFSILNPQAVMDVFIILGGASTHYHGATKGWFTTGVITASFIWFFALSLLASKCHRHFKTPRTWAWLEGVSGTLMFGLATYFALTV